jgi:polyhydroxyalkanoate synthase
MRLPVPDVSELIVSARQGASATGRRLRNGARALTGLDRVDLATSPRHTIWRSGQTTLYRYESQQVTQPIPVLIVMSLVTKPDIFDLLPGMSLVEVLQKKGFDVYLLDWGVPGPPEAFNTIGDYTHRFLPRAIEATIRESGADEVNLLCYCLGGTLALLAVAADPDLPVAGVLSVATAIDFTKLGPIPNLVRQGSLEIEHVVDETGNVPPAVLARAIKLVKPTGDVSTILSLWDSLADAQALRAHRALLGWAGDHIPFPGAAAREFVELGMRQNVLVSGRMPYRGGTVDLADIRCRVMSIYGTEDALVPPSAHSMLEDLVPHATFSKLELPTGHVGLFFGRQARKATNAMVEWLSAPATPRTQKRASEPAT